MEHHGVRLQPLSCISRLMHFTELSCLQPGTMGGFGCGKPLPTTFGDWQVALASSRQPKNPLGNRNPKMSTWRTERERTGSVLRCTHTVNLILLFSASGGFWRKGCLGTESRPLGPAGSVSEVPLLSVSSIWEGLLSTRSHLSVRPFMFLK